ncbi:MAG: hypothetical protein HY340_04045 [Candidatus Kerfeldbacteria bacterium]|nr:hypothetical protein [Candidatus Kerfeldbacteria bacterium]
MTLTKQDLHEIQQVVRDGVRLEMQEGSVREDLRGMVREEVERGVEPFFTAIQQDIQRLDGRIDGIRLDLSGVRSDVAKLRVDLNELRPIRQELAELRDEVRAMTTTVDGYTKKTETWHDEFGVLKARHNKLHDVLVQKGVVSDDELTLG